MWQKDILGAIANYQKLLAQKPQEPKGFYVWVYQGLGSALEKDNQIDEEEKLVLRNIFSRVSDEELAPEVVEEIKEFRKKYDI